MSNPLIPISALEGLMKKAFIEKAVAPGLFWDALSKANLYVPLSQAEGVKKGETVEADPADAVDYPMLLGQDNDDKYVLWVFTSPAVMFEYIERKVPVLELAAPSMFSKIKDSEHEVVLIGPEGLTLSLHPDLLITLSEGKSPEPSDQRVQHVPKEAEVLVGEAEAEAEPLKQIFQQLFEDMPEVLEAAFIQVADDNGSRLLLGLSLENESRDALRAVTERIARAAEGVLDKGKSMDITFINGSLKGAFEKWGKPFYKKEE